MSKLLVILMATGSATTAIAGTSLVDVPMRFSGTRPAVEVEVNGKGPFFFLVDTGAGGYPARADMSLVTRLSIHQSGMEKSSDASGASASVATVVLDSVRLGGFAANNVRAISRDYGSLSYAPALDGILGIEFFKTKLLTLDFPHRRVRLSEGSLPRADGSTVLKYELVGGNICIPVTLGGHRVKAILDTGNMRALDIPSKWVQTMRIASFPRVIGTSSGVSGTVGLREVRLAEPLTIGRYTFPQPLVTFADEYGEANIGSTIWRNFVVTIDQQNRRVRLTKVK